MKIALVLLVLVWCAMVVHMLHNGRVQYIREFCPNAADGYCPRS
jgi:hypothetical protein